MSRSSAVDRLPAIWVQATVVAAVWIAVAAAGGLGDNLSPTGAVVAAGLAVTAANVAFDIPRQLRPGIGLALLIAGMSAGVLATGPSLGGDVATAVYVGSTLLALVAATAPRQPAALALAPSLALAMRAAPGVNTVFGLAVAAVAIAVAVVLVVTSGEERPHRDAPWGAAVVAVGIAALPFPLLDSSATLLLAAGLLVVAVHHPLAMITVLPGVAVATELLLVRGIPAREQWAGGLGAVAVTIAAYAAARELAARGLPRSWRDVPPGLAPGAAVAVWLLLAPQTWGWASRTVPTVLLLDGYVAGATRAAAGGLLAVAIAGIWQQLGPARHPDGPGPQD